MQNVEKYTWKRGAKFFLMGFLPGFPLLISFLFIAPPFTNNLMDSAQVEPYYNESVIEAFNASENAAALRDLNVSVVKSYFVREGSACREESVHVVGLDEGYIELNYDFIDKYTSLDPSDATEFTLSYDGIPNTITECPQSIEIRQLSGRYHLYLSRSNDTGSDILHSRINPK